MKNLLRRVSRLEERVFAIKSNPYEDPSDEELDRKLAELRQQLFGDDMAAFEAYMQQEFPGSQVVFKSLWPNAEEGR